MNSGRVKVCSCAVTIEEIPELKRTLWFLLLAALAPLTATGQVNPDEAPVSREAASFKYEVYAGYAYTGLDQVNNSRYGLQGGKLMLMRNWGKYFGLMGAIDYYRPPISNRLPANPGDPSVYSILVGPEIHPVIYENLSGVFFPELGVEHTGGEGMIPATSFAGGFGGGISYRLNNRFNIRITGDRVAGSFSLIDNTPQLAGSTHRTWDARATIGVSYRF